MLHLGQKIMVLKPLKFKSPNDMITLVMEKVLKPKDCEN